MGVRSQWSKFQAPPEPHPEKDKEEGTVTRVISDSEGTEVLHQGSQNTASSLKSGEQVGGLALEKAQGPTLWKLKDFKRK